MICGPSTGPLLNPYNLKSLTSATFQKTESCARKLNAAHQFISFQIAHRCRHTHTKRILITKIIWFRLASALIGWHVQCASISIAINLMSIFKTIKKRLGKRKRIDNVYDTCVATNWRMHWGAHYNTRTCTHCVYCAAHDFTSSYSRYCVTLEPHLYS